MKKNEETLQIIAPKVNKSIDKSRQVIFTRTQLDQLIKTESVNAQLSSRALTTNQVLNHLRTQGKLKQLTFEFPSRTETRYALGEISELNVAQSLKPKGYFVHRTAMYINNLLDEKPETIFINIEQAKNHTRNKGELDQGAINRAFQNKCRISNEIAETNGMKVCVVHGQKTENLGVITSTGPQNEKVLVTGLERTLVDIVVRPVYAGGTQEVLNAYAKAATKVSIAKLVEILRQMNYVYPYHQSVGFYLDRTGKYSDKDINLFREMPINHDFFLDYKMKNPKYSKTWKIHYPNDLIV